MNKSEDEKIAGITKTLEIEVEELEAKASAHFMVMPSCG